jgi:hypothetical protein
LKGRNIEGNVENTTHTPVETLDYDLALLMRACIMPLLTVVDQSSALGIKIPKSTYGWTRHHGGRAAIPS